MQCGHTEHAARAARVVGRHFPKDGPDEGVWEICLIQERLDDEKIRKSLQRARGE